MLALLTSASAAPANSAWLIFSTTDPHSGAVIRYARLSAQTAAQDGSAASVLELRHDESGGNRAELILRPLAAAQCVAISSFRAQFDGMKATSYPVVGTMQNGQCGLDITGMDGFLQSLRAAQQLVVVADAGQKLKFNVSGLVWSQTD